jgi:DNA-binding SARP family transcriptional activator
VQREDYRARLMAALETLLAAAIGEKHWDEGTAYGRRLLELDPLQEHVHRALMRCHFGLGNRPAALKQYAACEMILRDELQIEPMAETRQLFEKLAAPPTAQEQARDVCDPPDLILRSRCTPAQRIDAALANLSTARTLLEDASRQLLSAASDIRTS